MDSITQIALGAAVGEAVLGKQTGRRALAWGGFFGLLPDLDVATAPFVSEYTQLALHRGISHSLFFAVLAGLCGGWLLSERDKRRLLKNKQNSSASWLKWGLLVFLAVWTHALLDVCTVYGTQIWLPFSNYRAAINSVSIIDPLYSVPLLGGVIAAFILTRKNNILAYRLNTLGLILSTTYLLYANILKFHVEKQFETALEAQSIEYSRIMTNPTIFNTFLWKAIADDGQKQYIGLYSILDPADSVSEIPFRVIEKNTRLLNEKTTEPNPVIERLLWFSNDYYRFRKEGDTYYFDDLRFGTNTSYLTEGTGDFIFRFELIEENNKFKGFYHRRPEMSGQKDALERLFSRMMGNVCAEELRCKK